MDLDALNEAAISAANKLEVDDAVALSARSSDRMIRFANNSVTVANQVDEAELTVYLAKSKRRAIASTSNLDESSVKKFVSDLFASLKGLPASDYVPLPEGATKYSPSKLGFDKKLADGGGELPHLAKEAISASLAAGG